MRRESKFVKSTLILAIGTVMPKLASFVTLPLYTAYLTKAEYGTYDLILTLCSLFIPIATLMLPNAAFRFMIENQNNHHEQKKIVTNVLVVDFITAAVSLIVLYICLFRLSNFTRGLICLYFLTDITTSICQQIARGLTKNRIYSVSASLLAFTNMVLALIALRFLNTGIDGVIICLILATLSSSIYIATQLKLVTYFDFSMVDWRCIKQLLGYSWPLIPNNISSWVMNMSDRLIVLAVLGVEQNALLAVAHKIPQILLLVQNAFTMSWQENASLSVNDRDVDEYYAKMFSTLYYVIAGSTMVLIASTPLLFKILINGDYDEAFYQVPIYFVAFFLSCVSTYLGGIYLAYKKTLNVGVTTIISAIINVFVNALLIKWIGLYAASISTLCGYIFIVIYRYFDIQKIVKIRFDKKQIAIGIIGIAASCVLCYLRNPVIDLINIALSCTVCIMLNKTVIAHIYKMTQALHPLKIKLFSKKRK